MSHKSETASFVEGQSPNNVDDSESRSFFLCCLAFLGGELYDTSVVNSQDEKKTYFNRGS